MQSLKAPSSGLSATFSPDFGGEGTGRESPTMLSKPHEISHNAKRLAVMRPGTGHWWFHCVAGEVPRLEVDLQ